MTGPIARRYGSLVADHSKAVIALVLVVTVLIGAGVAVGEMEDGGFGDFDVDTEETRAADFVEQNYGSEEGIVSQVVVRDRGGNVLTLESMREGLRFQTAVADEPDLAATLDGDGFLGLENLVATAAYFEYGEGTDDTADRPTLTQQRQALDGLDEEAFATLLPRVLDRDPDLRLDRDPLQFLPESYVPGESTAESRLTLLRQVDTSDDGEDPSAAFDAQVTVAALLDERFDDAFIFGQGIRDEASSQATGDSFAIITPVALAILLFVLGIAYRDVLDVLLALGGILLVMVWLVGIMGWLAIPMNVILIAVPFLLVGLGIDYALHVIMRYREARGGRLEEGEQMRPAAEHSPQTASIRTAMAVGLGSVVLAIAAATFSTGVGFFSNVVSPLPAIRDFAVLSAGGILATFIVFGALVPALKVELDGFSEGRLGRSRAKPAFGVGEGVANRLLAGVASLAAGAPILVVVLALGLAVGGAYGATTIDTEFNEADFLPSDPPEWTSSLPGPLQPGSYTIADDVAYLSENFQLQGADDRSQVLIRGYVTDDAVLGAIDETVRAVGPNSAIAQRPGGGGAIEGPHTVLRETARENQTLAAAIDERDRTNDGLPDTDVEPVYALLFEVDESAASEVLSRDDGGEITSARLLVSVRGDRSVQAIAVDTRTLGTDIERSAPGVTAVATGGPVTEAVLQDALLENLVQAFSITLVVILVFLTVLFWRRYRSLSLGAVVLAPVVGALAWLLGAMALLDIPFNSETAVITSLAIGLGVDYSIHVGERFLAERETQATLTAALTRSITGTGGALLASAATTAAGFGVLALALSPPLRRFGIVTGSAIVLAFLACVTVLPCLFVLRERLLERFGRSED